MSEQLVSEHYEKGGLFDRILRGLEAIGKDTENLSVGDLAAVDEFHIRGRESTVELAAMAELVSGMRVLDVGCGIGGSARFLASEYGARVSGIDLTPEFVNVGRQLNDLIGVGDEIDLQVASALELPFEDEVFDMVWTEHVQMNIEDKTRFYGELWRVLKPGGKLVFHDIFAGRGGGVEFPVPWAGDESISFLGESEAVREMLLAMGFEVLAWVDKTAESSDWFLAMLKRIDERGMSPLGLHLVLGPDAREKFGNLQRNLGENRIQVVQAVMTR